MPRLALAVRPSLVTRLRNLQRAVVRADKAALWAACRAGRLLGGLPGHERDRLAKEAGISRRSAQDYARIAAHWAVIRAARCASIRQALEQLRGPSAKMRQTERLVIDLDAIDPAGLTQALGSVRNRGARVIVRLSGTAAPVEPGQMPLPFD